jgi:hypothetical protein
MAASKAKRKALFVRKRERPAPTMDQVETETKPKADNETAERRVRPVVPVRRGEKDV